MNEKSFSRVIDEAAEVCGGQNALARRVGADASAMAKYRAGKISVPDHVIVQIAEIVGMNAADVWILAKEARNPFRGQAAASGGPASSRKSSEGARINLWILALRIRGELRQLLQTHNADRARRISLPA